MSVILKEVYDAFLDAGASEEKATAAAQAVAGYGHGFGKIKFDLLVVKLMLGVIIVVNVLPILRTIFLS